MLDWIGGMEGKIQAGKGGNVLLDIMIWIDMWRYVVGY
jgi:hypothetical protein